MASLRITSQKHKLFVGIAVATLLTGMFSSSVTYAFTTAILTIGSSGNLRVSPEISGSLTVIGNRIFTASGRPIVLKGMCYTYFVNNAYATGGVWLLADGTMRWGWSETGVQNLLDFMRSSNANVVRVFMTVEYWLQNTGDFQNHIKYFVTEAAIRGVYTVLTFWNTGGTMEMPQGVHPWQDGNTFIKTSADFVNLWGNITTVMKNYPNLIFELFNEPTGDEAEWFSVTQQCITRIRSIGAVQPILIQYSYQINHDWGSGWYYGMDWVFNHPLTDPQNNLIYSTHLYTYTWAGFYNSDLGIEVTDYSSIDHALNECRVYEVASLHPVFFGEIGNNLWDDTLENGVRAQDIFYNNTLTLLDQHGIGYGAFAGPPWSSLTQWGLVEFGAPNYTLNGPGKILVRHLGG